MSVPVNSAEAFSGGLGAIVVGSGAITISAGDTVVAITALASGQITTVGNYALTAATIPAGTTIFGRWTAVTGAASNQAIAYLG
jgi:hypothetical protein